MADPISSREHPPHLIRLIRSDVGAALCRERVAERPQTGDTYELTFNASLARCVVCIGWGLAQFSDKLTKSTSSRSLP